jgi:hypothetical protein
LTGPEQAKQFVADRIAEGSDYLKIFGPSGTAGPRTMPSLDLDTITALTKAAHSRGLVVVAHVNSAAGVGEVVSAGVDVVAHIPVDGDRRAFVANAAEAEELDAFDARVAKVVAAVRERRYGFDPTKAS